jgi:phytoene synthase
MSSQATLSLLAEQVRRLDRDRFVTTLFAPVERREALFGLYAFNIEVAQIREMVREPLLGRIRLQWWRDSLEELHAGRVVAHPVAQALSQAFTQFSLSRAPFDALLRTRERDMQAEPPDDLAALEAYAEGTAGAVAILGLEILGVRDPDALAAARSVGIAWGLTGLLRAVPFHAAAGRSYLPASLLADQGLSPYDVLASRNVPELVAVARTLAGAARDHLDAARRRKRHIPRQALPGLLTAPLAERYLGALAKSGFNLFDRTWSTPRPQPLRLGWAMLRGRI